MPNVSVLDMDSSHVGGTQCGTAESSAGMVDGKSRTHHTEVAGLVSSEERRAQPIPGRFQQPIRKLLEAGGEARHEGMQYGELQRRPPSLNLGCLLPKCAAWRTGA